MLNPHICKLCIDEGFAKPADFLVHFVEEGSENKTVALCEDCFLRFPPEEFSSIENLHITLERERGCCD